MRGLVRPHASYTTVAMADGTQLAERLHGAEGADQRADRLGVRTPAGRGQVGLGENGIDRLLERWRGLGHGQDVGRGEQRQPGVGPGGVDAGQCRALERGGSRTIDRKPRKARATSAGFTIHTTAASATIPIDAGASL